MCGSDRSSGRRILRLIDLDGLVTLIERRQMVERALETGEPFQTSRSVQTVLTGGATLLALATTLMIIFN